MQNIVLLLVMMVILNVQSVHASPLDIPQVNIVPSQSASPQAELTSAPWKQMVKQQIEHCLASQKSEDALLAPQAPVDHSYAKRNPLAANLDSATNGNYQKQMASRLQAFDNTTKSPVPNTPLQKQVITYQLTLDSKGDVLNIESKKEVGFTSRSVLQQTIQNNIKTIKGCSPFNGLPEADYEKWKKFPLELFADRNYIQLLPD